MPSNLISLARRRQQGEPSLLELLHAAMDERGKIEPEELRQIAATVGLPEATVIGVATYYADVATQRGRKRIRVCTGTACFAARQGKQLAELEEAFGCHLGEARLDGEASLERALCLGRCDAGPVVRVDQEGGARHAIYTRMDGPEAAQRLRASEPPPEDAERGPEIRSFASPTIVLRNLVDGARAATLREARERGVYDTLRAAIASGAGARILDELELSGLRERGGAGSPCATHWRAVAAQPAERKFVVCNADEGDPSSFIDRLLLERDPHSILEGMALAGLAVGASMGVIYIRSDYPEALGAMERAVLEAQGAKLLGQPRGEAGFCFEVEVVEGAGNSAVRDLFGCPTAVSSVETLVNVPWIVARGGEAYRRLGAGNSRGTKAVSLNERFVRPGLYEVELGTPLRRICEELGGGLREGRAIKAVQVGGPLARILPAWLLDVPLGFEELEAAGGQLGRGSIVAFDDRTDMGALALHLTELGGAEAIDSLVRHFPDELLGSRS